MSQGLKRKICLTPVGGVGGSGEGVEEDRHWSGGGWSRRQRNRGSWHHGGHLCCGPRRAEL